MSRSPFSDADDQRHNLPTHLTRFIGRERELAEVQRALATVRLLTLSGTGGVGKTRLALRAAADLVDAYPDGVRFVEFARLAEPSLVPRAVASALGLSEERARPLLATLADYLRPRHVLLVLDNCEHVVSACASLAEELLCLCADVRMLVTSREALGIPGETVWRVPSLSVPFFRRLPPVADLAQYEAIQLFVDRASAVQPGFALTQQNAPAVAQICHRLDGIPLAIELAAARVKVLAPGQIVARLDDRFNLLTGGSRTALPRYQTLRALVGWSYDLLSEPERVLWRCLSVFAGGWTLETAEGICAGDGIEASDVLHLLSQLIDKSLVLADGQDGEVRYSLLETIRQYGRERLRESAEESDLRRRHRDWFLALAEEADAQLRGADQDEWLARLEREHDNLRAALAWSVGPSTPPEHALRGDHRELGLRLAGALAWFWWVHGHFSEGQHWLEQVLAQDIGLPTTARMKALNGAGIMAWAQGQYARAAELQEESAALARGLGDPLGLGIALGDLGLVAHYQDDFERATALFDEALALFRAIGHNWRIGWALRNLGRLAFGQGSHARARALLEESLTFSRQQVDRRGTALSLQYLGLLAHEGGDAAGAAALLEESVALSRRLGDKRALAWALHSLGLVAHGRGDHRRAASLYGESLTLRTEIGDKRGIAESLEGLAGVAGIRPEAARLFGAAAALREALAAPLPGTDRARYDRDVAAVRAGLGEQAFAAAVADGRAMAADRAAECALLVAESAAAATQTEQSATDGMSPLTRREQEIAALIARGLTNRQIAAELVITERTAEVHVRNILAKLGFTSRAHIAAWTVERQLSARSG